MPELETARTTAPFSPAVASDREVIAVDAMPAEPAAPAPRPRLDHVVTLGETPFEPYTPTQAAPPGNGGVVINNNITVNGSDPGYYGGYGAYGGYYGGSSYGYGARGTGRSRGTAARTTGTGGGSDVGTAAQAPPARTGQTPGVGGNWPTVPSYGPRQMR